MRSREQGRVFHDPDIVTASVDCKEKVGPISEVYGKNFTLDTSQGTTSMSCNVEPTKSGYITFDQGGLFIINWEILYQESDSKNNLGGESNKITNSIL